MTGRSSCARMRAMQAALCLALAAPPALAADEIAIIVHKDNPAVIDTAYVTRIYTGLLKGWPDGSPDGSNAFVIPTMG